MNGSERFKNGERAKERERERQYLHQEAVVLWVGRVQPQSQQQRAVPRLQQLVEDMEVPLSMVLVHHPRLLQKVVQDVAANRSALNPGAQRQTRD